MTKTIDVKDIRVSQSLRCPKCSRTLLYANFDKGLKKLFCHFCSQVYNEDLTPETGDKPVNKYSVSPPAERTIDGEVLDSKREAKRYADLLLLRRAGAIHGLARQVSFACMDENRKVVERYVADFVYLDPKRGGWIVEDAKGLQTTEYRRKKRWMKSQLGIEIQEV